MSEQSEQLVVCFGAGRVAGPLVSYLLRRTSVSLCVASAIAGEAEELCMRYRERGSPVETKRAVTPRQIDVMIDDEVVEDLCERAACVVALVPVAAQLRLAQVCIKTKTPLVTASYPSSDILSLDAAAKDADVPILCEMGLDPGMDHMIAMKLIDDVKANDGRVVEFSSVCGGLPAPDAANNPIKYKFSWSPLGALRAAQRPAQYLANGEVVTIPGQDVLASAQAVNLFPEYKLDQIPNGDALPYAAHYKIPNVKSIFRGSLRFQGYCSIISQCVKIGLLNEGDMVQEGDKWVELLAAKVKAMGGDSHVDTATQVFLHWLGLDAPSAIVAKSQSIVEALCEVLLTKLSFEPGERDLVLMQVGVKAEYPDGSKVHHEALFEAFGDPEGDTIMAKTVGVTVGTGVKLVLDGAVRSAGILSPTMEEIYKPALELLAFEGILFQERQS